MAKITTEDFIRKAREVHGDKYDYSKVEYINANTKVIIICSIHGEFQQTPSMHTNDKNGCKKCFENKRGKSLRIGIEDFIKKAREIHGDKYDYSKVEYVNGKTEVSIVCPIHGEFLQKPKVHLNGSGCQKCFEDRRGQTIKSNSAEFIQKAKEIHGNKYDYSKINYIGNHEKMTIICLEHGEFLQTPHSHLNGNGCPKCAHRSFKYTTEEFIQKAKEIHGNKYDYSKVNYINSKTNVIIICSIHGEFLQGAHTHLNGHGCSMCSGLKKLTIEDFVEKAKKIHGNKYDYSKVEYINSSTKIIIICSKHGEFLQTPSAHLIGQGCAKCTSRGLNYLSYEEAKKYIRNLGIKNHQEYQDWWIKNRPEFLPFNIERYFKNHK